MFIMLGCDSADQFACFFADMFDSLDGGDIKTIVIFGVGGIIAVTAILASSIRAVVTTRAREATKREMAAYVAEGTVKPDDAVAMLKAGIEKEDESC